ncbi:unnamed protein product [Auanema sp. JU1783]|nr:unnamed protein product [Auanema sp. JU1783]
MRGRVVYSIEGSLEKKENKLLPKKIHSPLDIILLPENFDLSAITSSIAPEGCLARKAPKRGKMLPRVSQLSHM